MWLLDKMKTRNSAKQRSATEWCPVLDILDENGDGLNNLNLNLVAPILLDNANDILEHILLKEESTHITNQYSGAYSK